MKRISMLLVAGALCAMPAARAQDAATQQRLDELSGKIETLTAGQETLRKQIAELVREVDALREKANKTQPTYASHEDLKRVAEAVETESRNRVADYDKIRAELKKLGAVLRDAAATPAPAPKNRSTTPSKSTTETPSTPPPDQKGFEYKVKPGDTFSTILQAYRDQNVKVKRSDILKANPGLNPDKIKVGDTIFIPAPKS